MSCTDSSIVSSVPSGQSWYSTFVRAQLLPPINLFRFIIHWSSYHSEVCSLMYWQHCKIKYENEAHIPEDHNRYFDLCGVLVVVTEQYSVLGCDAPEDFILVWPVFAIAHKTHVTHKRLWYTIIVWVYEYHRSQNDSFDSISCDTVSCDSALWSSDAEYRCTLARVWSMLIWDRMTLLWIYF